MHRWLALFLLPLAAACDIFTTTTDWYALQRVDKPAADVLAVARDVCERQGYPVESEDSVSSIFITKWRTNLSPHWREGRRERIEVWVETQANGVVPKVRTYREINDEDRKPQMASEAKWIPGGGDQDLALRILEMIKMRLARPSMDH